jgi:hypothetical protein
MESSLASIDQVKRTAIDLGMNFGPRLVVAVDGDPQRVNFDPARRARQLGLFPPGDPACIAGSGR